MRKPYRLLYREGFGEVVEKKSKFIASLHPSETEEEALKWIEEQRRKYYDARHHCYAYVIGENQELSRCSDDGEPSQTAGKPMLDVLLGEELHYACAVVTRYFGGTLLGTGGLVRAYRSAVKSALEDAVIVTKCPAHKISVDTDYNGAGKVQYLLANKQIPVLDCAYTDRVVFTVLVPEGQKETICKALTEATNGRVSIECLSETHYAMQDKNIILF